MEPMPSLTHSGPICILVVDDHPSTATTLARALSQLGPNIEVISATSGEVALELVQDKPVDLLITDMMMVGLNGLELIEQMLSHPGGRPAYTILMTAYDIPGLKISARRLDVNEIIIKPIRPERMCQIVAKAIEGLGDQTPLNVPETRPQPKILIADDLPDNLALLSRYLLNEGYACITASDGDEALRKMRYEIPDLVLLDVNMPVKDGFETLQEIRSDPAIEHIPVIILTAARVDSTDVQTALNMGADDYVTKPFDRRELLARIRTRLRVKEAEDVIRRRNRELRLLPEIGRELSARLDVDELIDIVARRTVETLGAVMGHIILLSHESRIEKTKSFSRSLIVDAELQLPPLEILLSTITDAREGVVIADVHKDTRWQNIPGELIHSVVIVPMYGRFELLGLLLLAHEQSGYFTLEHRLMLQAIASQAAIAIENAQLFSKVEPEKPKTGPLPRRQPALEDFDQARFNFLQALAAMRSVIARQGVYSPEQKQFIEKFRAAVAMFEAPLANPSDLSVKKKTVAPAPVPATQERKTVPVTELEDRHFEV